MEEKNISHKSLVSIIIPNYNRANLIGETLDSIISQTYSNWECIIVDDGSADNSIEVINSYVKKDSRFKFFLRPKNHPKGANACRNIGMQKAVGDYIIFFDSDDFMCDNHIESKLLYMSNGNLDYAVFKSKHFNLNEDVDYSYYKKYDFNADNYLMNKLRFFTNDLIVRRELLKKCVFYYKYNADIENIIMTQLVLLSNNNGFQDEVVTLKRHHNENITQQGMEGNQEKKQKHVFFYYFNILDYIYYLNASEKAKYFILSQLIYAYRQINFRIEVNFFVFVYKISKFRKLHPLIAILTKRFKKLITY